MLLKNWKYSSTVLVFLSSRKLRISDSKHINLFNIYYF